MTPNKTALKHNKSQVFPSAPSATPPRPKNGKPYLAGMMRYRDVGEGSALDLVNLAETKDYLRVDTSDDDALITRLIEAAAEQVASMTNTQIKPIEAYGYLEHFRNADFPVGPVTAVTSVEYKASGNTYTTLDTGSYHLRINTHPARIEFDNPPNLDDDQLERVRISFRYGVGTAEHPRKEAHILAVRMLAAHYYDNRSPVSTGPVPRAVPMHVEALINPLRKL